MSFDAAQFLRNTVRLDRADLMMPQIVEQPATAQTAETGRLNGAPVTVMNDPTAELQDAMEELSM